MFAKGQTVIQWMEALAPKYLAEPDDRIGLQLGTLQKRVERVLVTLDVTEQVADEAIRLEADLIVAHHAIIYKPLKHLQTDTFSGRIYEKLIKHDIAVYVAHTNLDSASGGMNDMMAEVLGLSDVKTLVEPSEEQKRVEGAVIGLGRVGKLEKPMSLEAMAQKVKVAFEVPMVRVVGDLSATVRKVAVLGGAGSKYTSHARFAGADVLITGDIDYHTAQDALADGLFIIDPGHHAEKIMKRKVAAYLQRQAERHGFATKVMASQIETEPFRFI